MEKAGQSCLSFYAGLRCCGTRILRVIHGAVRPCHIKAIRNLGVHPVVHRALAHRLPVRLVLDRLAPAHQVLVH